LSADTGKQKAPFPGLSAEEITAQEAKSQFVPADVSAD
jgi:hypothetical protein